MKDHVAKTSLVAFVLVAGGLAVSLGASPAHANPVITVNDTTGNDTGTIQAAINLAYNTPGPDVVSLGPVADGCYSIRATDLTDPDNGINKAHALVLKSEVGNELTFQANDEPMCRRLAPVPASQPGTNPTMAWFKAFDVQGVTITGLNVDGGATGLEDPEDRADFIDFLLWWDGIDDLEVRDSFAVNMYGLCGIGAGISNSTFENFTCQNPARAGLNFQGNSYNNLVVNAEFTSTGDDAIAFNTFFNGRPTGGVVRDNTIRGGVFTQDPRTRAGGSLSIRGGHGFVVEPDSQGIGTQFGAQYPSGTETLNRDAVFITREPNNQDPSVDEPSHDITIDGATIYYYGTGIHTPSGTLADTGAIYLGDSYDIEVTNSEINYPTGCPVYGIYREAGVPLPSGLSTDVFNPNGACNTN